MNWDAEPGRVRGRSAIYLFGVILFFALQPAQDFNTSLCFNAFLSLPFRTTSVVLDASAPRQDRHTITKLMERKWHLGELDLIHARQAN